MENMKISKVGHSWTSIISTKTCP